ncbi:hypothetical protein [Kitasatospora sp. NPDC088548]|uniref:hypothetical protein n=1 Tax=Kitasatospora sp. NPDC088548 TaxID=3364075 RepID=UPI0038294CF0
MAHPFVQVEERELGAGVGAFAPHDGPGAVRVAGEVDHAGQFGDLGPGAEGAVLFEGGVPELLGQRADGFAELGGDGVSGGEGGRDAALPESAQVGWECLGAARDVGADEDLGAVAVGVGDLSEGGVDRDVVGGGVHSGVAWSQEDHERPATRPSSEPPRLGPLDPPGYFIAAHTPITPSHDIALLIPDPPKEHTQNRKNRPAVMFAHLPLGHGGTGRRQVAGDRTAG